MSSPVGHVLGLGHIIVGAGAIITPFTAAAVFRIVQTPSTVFITKAFGSRDLVTGLGIQLYERGQVERRAAVLACATFHAIDVVNAIISYVQGYISSETLVIAAGIDTLLVGLCWLEMES